LCYLTAAALTAGTCDLTCTDGKDCGSTTDEGIFAVYSTEIILTSILTWADGSLVAPYIIAIADVRIFIVSQKINLISNFACSCFYSYGHSIL